jgi:hypothetical protein
MSEITYRVVRRHEGDRMYEEGETRTGTKAELGHLVPNVLVEMEAEAKPQTKAEPAPSNKAEPAPRNKSKAR